MGYLFVSSEISRDGNLNGSIKKGSINGGIFGFELGNAYVINWIL